MIPMLSAVNLALISSDPSPVLKGLVEVETTDDLYCFPFFKFLGMPVVPSFIGIENITRVTFVATNTQRLMGFEITFDNPFNEPLMENSFSDFSSILDNEDDIAKSVHDAMKLFSQKGEVRDISLQEVENVLSNWDFDALVKQETEKTPSLMDFYHAVSVYEVALRMKREFLPVFLFYEKKDAVVIVSKEVLDSFFVLFSVLSDHSLNGEILENVVVAGELFVPLYDKPYKARIKKVLQKLEINSGSPLFVNGFLFTPEQLVKEMIVKNLKE